MYKYFVGFLLICLFIDPAFSSGQSPKNESLKLFQAKIIEQDPGGPDIYNWACPNMTKITTAANQGNNSYLAKNMLDHDSATAWVEGVKGKGIGEWIEFKLVNVTGIRVEKSFLLQNGYAKNVTAWKANGRVKKLKVYFNGKPISFVLLIDTINMQHFTVDTEIDYSHTLKTGDTFRFEIIEVYPGDKYEDTGISTFIQECEG